MEIVLESGRLSASGSQGWPVVGLLGDGVFLEELVFAREPPIGEFTVVDSARGVMDLVQSRSSPNKKLLVLVVVRERGNSWLIPEDLEGLSQAAAEAGATLDDSSILFGVHASSPQRGSQPIERVWNVASHMVRWSSPNASHQLAIYDRVGKPKDLEVVD
jgi:hypothetical protein